MQYTIYKLRVSLDSFMARTRLATRNRRRETLAGYIFIMPNLIGFFVFTIGAVIFSLFLSFTDYSLIKPLSKINLVYFENYAYLFKDKWFHSSVINNLWLLLVIPIQMFLALVVASVLNGKVFFKNLLRTSFYLPNITNIVAIAVVWFTLFHPRFGPINNFLRTIGFENPPGWLADVRWSKPSLGIIMVWRNLGYYSLLYLAALQGIPSQLYEASRIDGAKARQQFVRITIPLVAPTSFLIMLVSVMNIFKSWTLVQSLTEGGPGMSTYTIGYYIYYKAFKLHQIGYASAVAWMLLIIVMTFAVIQFKRQQEH